MEYKFASVEEQITHHLIDTLLEAFPNEITVEDECGEAITDKPTRDHDEIFEACRAVDVCTVHVSGQWVLLVNGNGEDVLSDYTVDLEDTLKPLNEAINNL